MKFVTITTLVLASLVQLAIAADIQVQQVNPQYSLVEYKVTTPAAPKGYAHIVLNSKGNPVKLFIDSGDKSRAAFTGPPGKYVIFAVISLIDGSLDQAQQHITIAEDSPPTPQPPGPTPTPPSPTPSPTPTPTPPIPSGDFRVIILEESSDRAKLTKEQQAFITSPTIRNYLNSKTKEWRLLDKDETPIEGSQVLKDAFKAVPKDKVPSVVIIKGTSVELYTLPTNEAAMMELLKKYGGS